MRRTLTTLASALLVTAAARRAHAAPCTSLNNTIPIVWVENGDTQEPLMKRLGQQLIASATPIRIVYKNRRTCDLADDMYNGKKIVNDSIPIRYIPAAGEVVGDGGTWDPSKPSPTCEADATADAGAGAGHTIDLAIGATFLSSCTSLPTKPADIAVLDGPVQAYGFIVPTASAQVALTAEEGYFAFGFADDTGKAEPWTSQALRFIRGTTASTALTTSAAIGLKAAQLKGTIPPNNTSTEVLNLVAGSATPERTIGLMGTEVYDSNRSKGIKLLAFKAFRQKYAYFPDSSKDSFDKKNVRDGHYLPWSPTPYIARVDGAGKAVNANAQRVIDLVFGDRVDADVNGLEQVIASGLVPECAMQVARPFEGANLTKYQHPFSCTCYFDAKVPQGATTCKTCTDDNGCNGAGKCRRGYCEAR